MNGITILPAQELLGSLYAYGVKALAMEVKRQGERGGGIFPSLPRSLGWTSCWQDI